MAGGLFEGSVRELPQGGETTQGQTPAWYQNLLYDQMMAARAAASMPFEPYALPRVAQQTPDQTAAYQSVRQNIGAWQPSYDIAMRGSQSLGGEAPGVTSGVGYMQAAAGYNPMLAQQPYLNTSAGTVGNALNLSGLQTAAPFLTASSALGLGSAQSAAPLAAAYMNPFNEAVTSQIARLGARNLQENLLPAISDQFIRAGQFGGSRMGEFGARALRDTQESILAQQAQALQAGYGQALGASQADLARQLQVAAQQAQLGSTAGGMTQAQQQALMQGAQQYAGLGQQAGAATQQYGSALQNIGQGIGSLSLNEAQRQQSALAQLAELGRSQQGLVAQDAAAMEAIGQAQQAQKQRELDAAYQQFQEQQRYPQTMLDWYQAQLKGVGQYLPSTTTQSGYTTQMGLSPLSQLASGFTAYRGLTENG
jgi:hypothetical protein